MSIRLLAVFSCLSNEYGVWNTTCLIINVYYLHLYYFHFLVFLEFNIFIIFWGEGTSFVSLISSIASYFDFHWYFLLSLLFLSSYLLQSILLLLFFSQFLELRTWIINFSPFSPFKISIWLYNFFYCYLRDISLILIHFVLFYFSFILYMFYFL